MRRVSWIVILIFWLVAMIVVVAAPRERELTPEQDLGRRLFFDPVLSDNGKVSCATCHIPDHGFASIGLPIGLDGKEISRRAPTLLNRGKGKVFFWDGRASSLKEQMLGPILNPVEMGNKSMDEVVARVRKKYELDLTADDILDYISDFERTLVIHTRFDKHLKGEPKVLTESESRGWNLFRGKAQCYKCHDPKKEFTDEKFHNTGVGFFRRSDGATLVKDGGRYNITGKDEDKGKFKTPGLRGVRFTKPYMHDGSIKDLEDIVEFYNQGGIKSRVLDPLIFPLRLTEQEKKDLAAFLRTL